MRPESKFGLSTPESTVKEVPSDGIVCFLARIWGGMGTTGIASSDTLVLVRSDSITTFSTGTSRYCVSAFTALCPGKTSLSLTRIDCKTGLACNILQLSPNKTANIAIPASNSRLDTTIKRSDIRLRASYFF